MYAILHRQEVFEPFKNHPRFNELLENIYTVCLIVQHIIILHSPDSDHIPSSEFVCQVLDFFNSRMDMQQLDGEWSVDKVLELINKNCRSWRGEGMKVRNML